MQERSDSLGCWLRRRQLLALGALLSAAAPTQVAWAARSVAALLDDGWVFSVAAQ